MAVFTCSRSCSVGGVGCGGLVGEGGGVEWTEEAVEAVEGDGGIAELLKSDTDAS